MLRHQAGRLRCLLVLACGIGPAAAWAGGDHHRSDRLRWEYVSISAATLPPGVSWFDPTSLANDGRVYGNAYEEVTPGTFESRVAYYDDGVITVLQPGIVFTANEHRVAGGSVFTDLVNFYEQAAFFRRGVTRLLPRLEGEISSRVLKLKDSGLALVGSFDASFLTTYYLYKNGRVTPLPGLQGFSFDLNDRGKISGSYFVGDLGVFRGFRYDVRTGRTMTLDPLPTEPHAWGVDINDDGEVLGYSFIFGGLERIGIWDRKGVFKTYFVEGTPEYPTVSNRLYFNEEGLIVVSLTTDQKSYVVPRPGVRIDLGTLVDDAPVTAGALWYVFALNERGDMVGYGIDGTVFYLRRITHDHHGDRDHHDRHDDGGSNHRHDP